MANEIEFKHSESIEYGMGQGFKTTTYNFDGTIKKKSNSDIYTENETIFIYDNKGRLKSQRTCSGELESEKQIIKYEKYIYGEDGEFSIISYDLGELFFDVNDYEKLSFPINMKEFPLNPKIETVAYGFFQEKLVVIEYTHVDGNKYKQIEEIYDRYELTKFDLLFQETLYDNLYNDVSRRRLISRENEKEKEIYTYNEFGQIDEIQSFDMIDEGLRLTSKIYYYYDHNRKIESIIETKLMLGEMVVTSNNEYKYSNDAGILTVDRKLSTIIRCNQVDQFDRLFKFINMQEARNVILNDDSIYTQSDIRELANFQELIENDSWNLNDCTNSRYVFDGKGRRIKQYEHGIYMSSKGYYFEYHEIDNLTAIKMYNAKNNIIAETTRIEKKMHTTL